MMSRQGALHVLGGWAIGLAVAAAGAETAAARTLEVVVLLREPAVAERPPASGDATRSDGARVARVAALRQRFIAEAATIDFMPLRGLSHFPIVFGEIAAWRLRALAALPSVEAVEEVRTYRVQRIQGGNLIRAPQLRTQFSAAGAGIGVAVLDTGIDPEHPELAGRIVAGTDFTGTTGSGDDDHGHGTLVAGIIGGSLAGMAPAARLWSAKVTTADGTGTSVSLLEGLNWVFANRNELGGIRAVNMSIGGGGPVDADCDEGPVAAAVAELTASGIAVVIAAGNDGSAHGVTDLACLSRAIAVGAVYDADVGSQGPYASAQGCADVTTAADQITCYSNSGAPLDVFAPAQCAMTSARGGGQHPCFGGTSAAAAYVSGVAAQILSARPSTTPAQLRQALAASGKPLTDRHGLTRSRIDALAAFQSLDTCVPDADTACLVGGRFRVEMTWRSASTATAPALAVPTALENSTVFFFHNPDNWEVLLKVLDGCALNDHYWVFLAGATNVEFEITLTDTQSGQTRAYSNPLGRPAPPVQDVSAFATCP